MGLSVLAVVVIWFVCAFLISHFFETKDTNAQKKRFHIATALHILINIMAFIAILTLLFG